MSQNEKDLSKRFTIIKTFFQKDGYDALLKLRPEERIFIYYLHQAMLPGYQITLFQFCKFPDSLSHILKIIERGDNDSLIKKSLKKWFVYLMANYGPYCQRESVRNKKVPSDLGLQEITQDLVEKLYKEAGIKVNPDEMKYLFDPNYLPTSTVPKNIEESGYSFYGPGITNDLYKTIPEDLQNKLNAYHFLDPTEDDKDVVGNTLIQL